MERIDVLRELKEINQVLELFDNTFDPSISDLVGNLSDYSRKLYNNATVICIKSNNEIAGFAAFYCNDNESETAFLTQIAVKKELSSRGYGTKLLRQCEIISKQNDMKSIRLEVYKNNVVGQSFYKKNGYTFEKECSKKSIFMKKDL